MATSIPTLTLVLNAFGLLSLLSGGFVTMRSAYLRESSKEAVALIDTQRKRIDALVETLKDTQSDRDSMHASINQLEGQLKAYRELSLVKPEIITGLIETQNKILAKITDTNGKAQPT